MTPSDSRYVIFQLLCTCGCTMVLLAALFISSTIFFLNLTDGIGSSPWVMLATCTMFLSASLVACCAVYYFASPAGVCSSAVIPTDRLNEILYDFWADQGCGLDLPDVLKGAFWMSDNPASELAVSFMGSPFLDRKRRIQDLWAYQEYSWTRSKNGEGYLLALFGSFIPLRTKIRFFWNEDYSFARMRMYIFLGLIPVPEAIAKLTIRRLDKKGERWARDTFFFGQLNDWGSYTLIKVVDPKGKKLPAFNDMVQSTSDPKTGREGTLIKDFVIKTFLQVYTTAPCSCVRCKGGRAQPASSMV